MLQRKIKMKKKISDQMLLVRSSCFWTHQLPVIVIAERLFQVQLLISDFSGLKTKQQQQNQHTKIKIYNFQLDALENRNLNDTSTESIRIK